MGWSENGERLCIIILVTLVCEIIVARSVEILLDQVQTIANYVPIYLVKNKNIEMSITARERG